MAKMTDPTDAMVSFQEALHAGEIEPERGRLDPDVYFFADVFWDTPRLTYVFLQGRRVVAFANFVRVNDLEGSMCFQLGYAVPQDMRGKGLATRLLRAAIMEMQQGFASLGSFTVEAVIGETNLASQKVAERGLTSERKAIKDKESGLPAFYYVQKFKTSQRS